MSEALKHHLACFLMGFFGMLLVGLARQEREPSNISPTIH